MRNVRLNLIFTLLAVAVGLPAIGADRIHEWSFFSVALQQEMSASVVAPETSTPETPVLVFLHGRGRHHRSWLEVTASRDELLAANMWVILPDGEDGWYINSPVQQEARYEDYLSEVIEEAKQRFALTADAARWSIGGWSMGGYGAVRYATRHAADFGTVVSVIGVIDFPREPTLPEGQNYAVPVDRFGDDPALWRAYNPVDNVRALQGVAIMLITADTAFDRTMNENFSAELNRSGIEHRTLMLEGGHTFAVVQASLRHVLELVQQPADEGGTP